MDDKVRKELLNTLTKLDLNTTIMFSDILSEYYVEAINSASTYHICRGSVFNAFMESSNEKK